MEEKNKKKRTLWCRCQSVTKINKVEPNKCVVCNKLIKPNKLVSCNGEIVKRIPNELEVGTKLASDPFVGGSGLGNVTYEIIHKFMNDLNQTIYVIEYKLKVSYPNYSVIDNPNRKFYQVWKPKKVKKVEYKYVESSGMLNETIEEIFNWAKVAE